MLTTPDEIAPVLKSLIETCKDGQEGFRTAAEAIEADERLKSFLLSCSEQRGRFAAELEDELGKLGDYSSESSSVAGTLHRGWINLKSALTSKNIHSVLAECERGESVATKEYQKAIDSGLPVLLDAIVARQRQEIVIAHSAVRESLESYPAPDKSQFVETVQTKSREFAASATDTFQRTRDKASDALQTSERYVRQNPMPIIITAFGLGFLVAVLIRVFQHAQEEQRPSRRIEKAVDKAVDAVDIRPYVLPFIWPVVKVLRGYFEDSSKSVQGAYKDSSKVVKKAYGKSSSAMEDAVDDAGKYMKAGVKKVKGLF